eukprot:TRINITY_DN791_c0_g1_i1.p1 TRINITY_DN791_c0_g1~~TRINITY_DN791_c0_g1_i1.p1  ORF type:complete len:390 (-),score=89.66 TRINITY_DN791_c0_g1_i1:151-1320(-)
MQWEESHIDTSNFDAWLASPQDPASARHHNHASTNVFMFGAHNLPQPSPSVLTTPSAASVGDFGAFRDFDVEPRGLFIDLPMPKDFKPSVYTATPNHHQIQSPTLGTLEIPAFGGAGPNDGSANSANPADMMLFISPKAMTFSQGFGLEPSASIFATNISASNTPFGGLKKDFQFGGATMQSAFDMTSPMFAIPNKFEGMGLDFPSQLSSNHAAEEDEFSDKGSLLQMIHQPAPVMPSLHQYHSALATSSSTSFSLNNNNEDESASSYGNEENHHSGNSNRLHRAHSEGDACSSSSATSSRPISEIASSCHHCKRRRHPNELKPCHRNGAKVDRNGAEAVSSRRTCRKRYCLGCLQKYGISFADAEQPGWTCMACRGLCECAACRRKGQ